MNTPVMIEELRDGTSTSTLVNDNAEVILVRDGAMDPRASHPRYLIADRDILGTTTLREVVRGDYEGRPDVSTDELNVATLCTVEEIDGHDVLVPFRTL